MLEAAGLLHVVELLVQAVHGEVTNLQVLK